MYLRTVKPDPGRPYNALSWVLLAHLLGVVLSQIYLLLSSAAGDFGASPVAHITEV